jgi:uncharacterized DUF497 family protein
MKYLDWNSEKNAKLLAERSISFEDIQVAIEEDGLMAVIEHPNTKKYPSQQVLLVACNEYMYLVPFVEDEEKIFLKTIIPSRQMTKKFLIDRRKP